MKTIVYTLLVYLAFTVAVNAQCVATTTDPCTTVHQSILDRAAKAIDELTEARKAIAAFQHERTATDAERAAYKNLAVVADTAMAILQKGIGDRDTVIALQQKAMEAFATLTEKLTAQLNKPKSAWSKFIATVEKVMVLLAGVAIGGAL